LIDPVGEKYIGSWKDGKRNGQGTSTFFGMKYVGKWKNGYRHGQGTYTLSSLGEFEGEWKGGRLWNGREYDKEGNILGKWVNGLVEKFFVEKHIVVRKEKGILFRDTPYTKFFEGGEKWIKFGDVETQVKFEGEIVDGVPNGEGTETFPNGEKYVGEFKDGLPNGQGTETYPSGSKFVGEYKDGLKNGQGTYTWSYGDKYVGDYKDGKQNGQGTYTWSDGYKYVGEFKNRKRWIGTQYDKDGNITKKYVNGEWIKQ